MKSAKLLLLGATLALAVGAASADNHTARAKDREPGFNALDKNNDGYISRSEASGNPYVKKEFKSADSNGDGRLSRAEYLAVMAKKDVKTGTAKAEHGLDRPAGAGK